MVISNNFWKIFFTFLIMLLVLVTFFGWEIYEDTKTRTESLMAERYQENLTKTIRDMDEIFRRVEVDLLQLSEKSALLNFKLMTIRGQHVDELLNLQNELSHMKMVHSISDSFYYYNINEGVIISDSHGSYPMDQYFDREWYRLFRESGSTNKLVRLPVRELEGVFYYTIIYSGSDFLLVANLNTEKIYTRIKNNSILTREKILISDIEGRLVHSAYPYAAALEINPNIASIITDLDDEHNVFQRSLFDQKEFIIVRKSLYNNWYYLIYVPLRDIEFQWINFRKVILVNLIPFGIIGIVLVVMLGFLIYGPYNRLADSLRKTYSDYGHGEKNAFDYIRKIMDRDITRISELEEMVRLYRTTTGQKLMVDYLDELIDRKVFVEKTQALGLDLEKKTFRLYMISGYLNEDFGRDDSGLHTLLIHGKTLLMEEPESQSLAPEVLNSYSGIRSKQFSNLEKLPRLVEKMENSLEYVKLYNLQGLHSIEEFESLKNDFPYPEDIEKKLLNNIHAGSYSDSTLLLEELFNSFLSEGFLEIWTFRRVVSRLLFTMLKQLPFRKALEFDVLQNAILTQNIEEIQTTVNKICMEITYYLHNLNQEENEENAYTKRAKNYIDEHYKRDISLEDIAGHLKISYPYLSKVFKDGAKENILYYINKKRIEKSKEYLTTTNKTMQEIASEVGYNNTQSFSRFFKKIEGITPGKYKKIKNESP